jgi:two-component system sensor histidine kinase KdpD
LAYNNPPGSRNPTRWRDVEDLLEAGIKVVASINIQYIAEFGDQVEAITAKRAAETVPVAFLQSADEIELVDAPAEEPIEHSPEQLADNAQRQQRLAMLRELALVLAADVVDHQLTNYLERHGIEQQFGAQERILVCVTPRANVQGMMNVARLIASRFHAELLAAYVHQPQLSERDRAALDEKLAIARAAGARIEILDGEDPVTLILNFARARGVTQLFIGHSQRRGLWARLWGTPVDRLIRQSCGMDIRVFPH